MLVVVVVVVLGVEEGGHGDGWERRTSTQKIYKYSKQKKKIGEDKRSAQGNEQKESRVYGSWE